MYIYKAGVVGAGTMGAEIAQVITYAGLPVVLKDVSEEFVQKGLDRIRGIYKRRVDKGKMTAEEMESKMSLVTGTTKYEDFKDVDIVIEAVTENIDLKLKLFRKWKNMSAKGQSSPAILQRFQSPKWAPRSNDLKNLSACIFSFQPP